MRRGVAALAVVLAGVLPWPAPAHAQQEPVAGEPAFEGAVDVPQPQQGPEPLWVPDPQTKPDPAEAATAAVEVAAPVAEFSDAGEDPVRVAVAHWMASVARSAGLPGELPVMAALVESGLRNLPYGHADSVGYFQMRRSIWDQGAYAGYLARPELQLRWFIERALAVRAARSAAGDATFGADAATWGDWVADVERPYEAYRGRYALRLDEARALLATPADAVAPFELPLGIGGAASDAATTAAELAQRVLADAAITLDDRARADLVAGWVDPRLTAVMLEAATTAPIAITVFHTGHSYFTVHGSVSNHSYGRAVDIGAVGGEPVSPANEAARALALALGELPATLRPTEIGTPWQIDEPGYFTDGDHQDHLHIGFDDLVHTNAVTDHTMLRLVPLPRQPASSPRAEPRFEVAKRDREAARLEPRFEVRK